MKTETYLARIGISGTVGPTAATLRNLMLAHLERVPFENLDIHLGIPISLALEDVYRKIVEHRRGGFCYELNGLFCWLLQTIGFDVDMLEARVVRSDGSLGIHFDHMALLVHLDNDWLVDVGFGDSHRTPLRVIDGAEHIEWATTYRVVSLDSGWALEQRLVDDQRWERQFVFTMQPHDITDYMPACIWQQTAPESHFTQQRVATVARPQGGRVTYTGMRRIETTSSGRDEQVLTTEAEWWTALADELEIVVGH